MEKADIVFLSETWTRSEINDTEISIKGYTIICKSNHQCIANRRGGGKIAYVQKEIQAIEVNSQFNEVSQAKMLMCTDHQAQHNKIFPVLMRPSRA